MCPWRMLTAGSVRSGYRDTEEWWQQWCEGVNANKYKPGLRAGWKGTGNKEEWDSRESGTKEWVDCLDPSAAVRSVGFQKGACRAMQEQGWSQEPLPLTGASYCRWAERGNLLLCEAAAPALALLRDPWGIVRGHRGSAETRSSSTEGGQAGDTESTERKNPTRAVEGLRGGKVHGIREVEMPQWDTNRQMGLRHLFFQDEKLHEIKQQEACRTAYSNAPVINYPSETGDATSPLVFLSNVHQNLT